MQEVTKNQVVMVPNGRKGIVVEVDAENRTAKVALDPSDELAGGASAARTFDFDELTAVKA